MQSASKKYMYNWYTPVFTLSLNATNVNNRQQCVRDIFCFPTSKERFWGAQSRNIRFSSSSSFGTNRTLVDMFSADLEFCQILIRLPFYSLSIWLPTLVLLSTPSSVPLANRAQAWLVYIFFTIYLYLFIQPVPLFLLIFPIEHLCFCSCFYSFHRDYSCAWQGMKISRKDFLYRVISDAVPPQKLPRTEKLILG